MYQIKFLKPLSLGYSASSKKVKGNESGYEVSSTLNISNDLGEQFFYGKVTLNCEIRLYETDDVRCKYKPIATTKVEWVAGKRAVDVKLEIPTKYLSVGKYIALDVSVHDQSRVVDETNVSDITHDELRSDWFPQWENVVGHCDQSIDLSSPALQIFPTMSSLIKIPSSTTEFPLKSDRVAIRYISDVVLYEELSGEIARHLWDAGIIVNNLSKAQFIKFLFGEDAAEKSEAKSKILELGTGIGLVSAHLSKMFTKSKILATDLADAEEICKLNIILNEVQDNVKFSELDWEEDSPAVEEWDLIVITDCTYNSLYYDALLNVLQRESNKNTKIILAHKFRESITEPQFFVKIQEHFHLEKQLWYNAQGQSLTHIGLYTVK